MLILGSAWGGAVLGALLVLVWNGSPDVEHVLTIRQGLLCIGIAAFIGFFTGLMAWSIRNRNRQDPDLRS